MYWVHKGMKCELKFWRNCKPKKISALEMKVKDYHKKDLRSHGVKEKKYEPSHA